MENTPITETQIWTTVLRATTCNGGDIETHHTWELESAAYQGGLSITQVYFNGHLVDSEGNQVVWDYAYHYEVEHREDGICESIWWPVLHRPTPVQPRPTYNVLVLLDKHGTVEVGTDGLLNVFILDETIKDHPNEPSEQEKQFFNLVWDRLPEHRGVDDNPSIYDFSAVGLYPNGGYKRTISHQPIN